MPFEPVFSSVFSSVMGGGFSPSVLFALSEPGIWYDPSDLTTMFQDTAGTVPVKAAGQSVAMVLDKSNGLVLGPELVKNGTFDANTAWTKGPGWVIASGVASITSSAATNAITQPVGVTGKTYQITYTVVSISTQGFCSFAGGTIGTLRSAPGTYTELIVCGSSNNLVGVAASASGTTGTIDNVSVKELPGNHATQTTAGARPTYQVDANGNGFLLFDGADDWLVTPTIATGTDKVQVFAGVRKLSDAATGAILAIGLNGGVAGANNENALLQAPSSASGANYWWRGAGTLTGVQANATGFPAPHTAVITGLIDISADLQSLSINRAAPILGTGDLGSGNFGTAQNLYIGRRGGTSLPFNGRIYGLIVRFGPNLTTDQIARVETWMNGKTGDY